MKAIPRVVRQRRRLLIGLVAAIAACSSGGPLVSETLDAQTGVTVLRATAPMILYSDNSAYAAHARDFVYLGPIEVNTMGVRSHYLWLGIWSTIRDDERLSTNRDGFESVVLFTDGEPLPLELAGWTPDAIGVSEPAYVKPVASAADAYYRVTLDQVRLLATADRIDLHVGSAGPRTYELWDEQKAPRAALREFARRGYD
ncbi:MAG: DUF3578 domain-containing protein [Gammaproteobacteria bacterium]|nr:DUF3578 domain-containing protein [Gammaproteobacteria bacterium]